MNFPIQDLTNLERDVPLTFDKDAVEQVDCASLNLNIATGAILGEDEQGAHTTSSVNRSDPIMQDLPPKSITLQKDTMEHAPIFGYAQLHFDEGREIIVPMLSPLGGRGTRRGMTPALFPPLYRAPASPARSFTTVSTLTAPDGIDNYSSLDDDDVSTTLFDGMMFGGESRHYLLKDSNHVHHVRTAGCSNAFCKFPKSLFRRKRRRREGRDPEGKREAVSVPIVGNLVNKAL